MAGIFWSKEELGLLKKAYPKYLLKDISRDDMQALFPKRSWASISHIATKKLRIKVKLFPDYDYLKELKKRGITI